MSGLVVALPEDVREALRLPELEQEARLRQELAIRLYAKGLLPLGKARKLSGLSKWDFLFLLTREGVSRRYDLEELEADLETLQLLA